MKFVWEKLLPPKICKTLARKSLTWMTVIFFCSPMAKFDSFEQLPVGEEDDFNKHDWKEEIKNMDEVYRFNLAISPFNWVTDIKTKKKKKWV